jgi:ABC-type antimicrobial peptide transport system permease subunit
MKNLIHSTFIFVILGAMLVVLTSTITFLCLTFISNVKGKYKEIAILKSFGTRKRKITGLFLLLNYFIAIVSIIGGLILAFVSLNFINMAFMSPNVFSINYSLLNTTPISLIIVILVPLLAALISTFLSLRKVNKIDIALALKMY